MISNESKSKIRTAFIIGAHQCSVDRFGRLIDHRQRFPIARELLRPPFHYSRDQRIPVHYEVFQRHLLRMNNRKTGR